MLTNSSSASSSVLPLSRVPDILKRMDLNSSQAEAMKTCFGILAIMSREDSNKLLIARDGMEIILNAMTIHVDRTDVQESGCDLLWSLAFSNAAVKDVIAKHGGATVLVRALKRHNRSSDFLKSACGALSNMCQSKLNQEGVSTQGGLQPLVGAIHIHQTNAKLLPFIFDAIASIIVNNEDNARSVSSLGIIPIILASLSRHKTCTDVVKSGCHTLAILSDVKGQASKIAFAGGVPIILSLLDTHPLYSDLHRVAAVVLLRMLQESGHVGREITCHEGVRILLTSLEKGGAQQDTVAAVTHILYTVTNPTTAVASAVESQLWLPASTKTVITSEKEHEEAVAGRHLSNPLLKQGSKDVMQAPSPSLSSPGVPNRLISNSVNTAILSMTQNTALGGIALIMGQYSSRRDVVRAACRLVNNLTGYNNVVVALEKINILDRMLECVHLHKDTKDISESTASVIKAMYRRAVPTIQAQSASCVHGLLHILKIKTQQDEEVVLACLEMFGILFDGIEKLSIEKRRELDDTRALEGKIWEHHALTSSVALLDSIIEAEREGGNNDIGSPTNSSLVKSISSAIRGWSKTTTKIVSAIVSLIESTHLANKLSADAGLTKDCVQMLISLQRIMPSKNVDLHKRLEKLLPQIDSSYGHQQQLQMQQRKQMQQERILAGRKSSKSLATNSENNAETTANGSSTSSASSKVGNGSGNGNSVGNGSTILNGGSISPRANDNDNKQNTTTSVDSVYKLDNDNVSKDGFIDNNQSTYDATSDSNWVEENVNSNVDSNGHNNESTSDSNQSKYNSHFVAFIESVAPTGVKKIVPHHPSKAGRSVQNIVSYSGQPLLECWPNYLERLLPTSGSAALMAMADSNNFTRMQIAYESLSAAGKGLVSKCPVPLPYNVPSEGIGAPFEHTLTFDSEFESGNLLRAVQKGDAAYDLFLRSDLHTAGHTQWFYFAVSNTHPAELVRLSEQGVQVPSVRVRFNIINFTKPDSLFNIGMRPVVYSCVDASTKGIGWIRTGSDISYYANTFQRNNTAGEGAANYYTLSFTIEFHNPKDTVLIAYSYPYTFEDYKYHLQQILNKPGAAGMIRQTKLCRTIGGEDCDLLVITNFRDKEGKDRIGPITMAAAESSAGSDFAFGSTSGGNMVFGNGGANGIGPNVSNFMNNTAASSKQSMSSMNRRESVQRGKLNLKPALFLSGRVHPGETPASWMMKGILDFLTSDCSQAKLLRQVFVIFIVPILNPDGVIYGNNRCSLAGVDLNRQWKMPSKVLHPTIYALKLLMMAQRKVREISMYVDLHGHSRKYNVFMYGCDDKKKPKPQVRAFPKFFSMHSVGRKYVCYADCSFHVKKGRESTARVVVSKELNIPCSFTLEATFCGSNYGPLKYCHMHIGHMQEVGAALCDAILNFSISEGQVKDAAVLSMVPAGNLKAVAQVEKALAELRSNDYEGLRLNDDMEDDEGTITKSKIYGSTSSDMYAVSGSRHSTVGSGTTASDRVGAVVLNTTDTPDLDLDDALVDNKEDLVSDESDNDIENDQAEVGNDENEIDNSNIAEMLVPDLESVANRDVEFGVRASLRIKSLSAEARRNINNTVDDVKTLSNAMPLLSLSASKRSFAAESSGYMPNEPSSLLLPLSAVGSNSPKGNTINSTGSYYLGGSTTGLNRTWNGSSASPSESPYATGMSLSPSFQMRVSKENQKEAGGGVSSILHPLSDRTGKIAKSDVNGSPFIGNGDLVGLGGFSSNLTGTGADLFGPPGDLASPSIVSSSTSQECNKDSLFSKSKKLADGKKKKISTGSTFASPNSKISGKKVAIDSLMINGTQPFSPIAASNIATNSEMGKTAAADSEDFEIMDSPRNATSSGNSMSMKGFEGKKGSNSTIVKSDYSDPLPINSSSDFSNLNNINIVKAQAPATTFGLPKMSQVQIK